MDRFEFYLADWQREIGNRARVHIGFDPLTAEELTISKSQVTRLLVSLDQFLETGIETCSICNRGHEGRDGLCERHGKRVPP